MGELVDNCYQSQRIAGFISMCLSAVVMILGYWWASHGNGTPDYYSSNGSGWGDGFGNKLALHGSFMLLGMCFCYTQAVTSFRALHFLGHDLSKALHSFWNFCMVAFMCCGLYYTIKWHNNQKLGHLTSMHSWLGIIVVLIVFQNWVLGFVNLGLPVMAEEWKKKYLPSHRFLGIAGMLAAAAAMESGIGQMSLFDDSSACFYTYTNDDKYMNNPASGYNKVDSGCRALLSIGVLLIINSLVAVYSLWQFPPDPYQAVGGGQPGNNNKNMEMVGP